MRCAAIHRKLGTHVSKVKSLSMDSWSTEQVENMKKVGNIASNKIYNPQDKKPPVPVDADEADGAMERFIRQKYMNRTLASTKRHNTGSTESDETPPPLPPKTPSRFGLRSASSIFPLGSKSKKAERDPSVSPRALPPNPPQLRQKSSLVFGASVQGDSKDGDETERKLAKLRDMGFSDGQRNAMVLKGVGGNLEKAVEALVRLGEGDGRSSVPSLSSSTRDTSTPLNRSLTPATSSSSRDAARGRPLSPASNNPFDMLDSRPLPPQPLSTQSTGVLQNRNPYASTNPFDMPVQQQPTPSALDMAFQNMSLAPPSQPLFPNHTGGITIPQQQNAQSLYQQPLTPPAHALGQSYNSMSFASNQTYPQPVQPAATSYNPFLSNTQPQQQPLAVQTTGYTGNYGGNPFARSPTRIQSPTLTQIPEQTQQNIYASQPVQPQVQHQLSQAHNPFFAPQQQMQMPQQQQQLQFQQPTQFAPVQYGLAPQTTGQALFQQQQQQQPQRPDKDSIMALYNYPQLAPKPNPFHTQQQQQQAQAGQQQHQDGAQQLHGQGQTQPQAFQQDPSLLRSQTFPLSSQGAQAQTVPQQQNQASGFAGSKNPFAMGGVVGASAGTQGTVANGVSPSPFATATTANTTTNSSSSTKPYNTSRESMMALGLEWTNGRHSPDAFASLSARDMR